MGHKPVKNASSGVSSRNIPKDTIRFDAEVTAEVSTSAVTSAVELHSGGLM